MKVSNIKDIEKFFEVVDSCEGRVELVTGEGDRLNLKSKLSQYVSLANIFSGGEIPELEIVAYEKEDIDKLNQSFLDEAQFNVDKMKAKFDPNLNVTTKVLVGFPAETIVKVAEEEDVGLIAISSSGKGRVTKFFIGSVAEKVIHSFKKDVLLVH